MKCTHLIAILGIGLLSYACGGDDGDSNTGTTAGTGSDADAGDSPSSSSSGSSDGADGDTTDGTSTSGDTTSNEDTGGDSTSSDGDAGSVSEPDTNAADGDTADAGASAPEPDTAEPDTATSEPDTTDTTDTTMSDTDAIAATMCDEDTGMTDETPECEAYAACAADRCDTAYEGCLGDNYADGDFSGAACEELLTCSQESADPCSNDCTPSTECTNCLVDEVFGCIVDECAAEYEECTGVDPAVIADLTGGGGLLSSEATCDDLADCCADLDAAFQETCQATVESGVDLSCGVTYDLLCGG